ncbi:hypothetical protein AMTR_s00135p00042190 [Amborella trichopoda]|uniref:Uncharacterized protein n=1 Tax=Amborella trichopoda TaxID=13333 RepID=W1P5E9_AMBTC|nr:hypothetical protein AMTR_s00135p00042190 [Amborella trichopoda]
MKIQTLRLRQGRLTIDKMDLGQPIVFNIIGNDVDDIPTNFKSRLGCESRSGDSGLDLMDQSQLEAILSGADDVCSVVRYQLSSLGGLELGVVCISDDTSENGTRPLGFQAAYSVTEVPSMLYLQTFSRALLAVGVTLEPSLLRFFMVRSL